MTVIGQPRHYHHKYKFSVEIDGLGSAAFQSCSELTAEVAKIEYSEGGVIFPTKEPGRITVSALTIERAATKDADLYHWFLQVADAALNGGLRSPLYKRNGSVVQMERDNTVLRRWSLTNCWPQKFTGGAWDNNSDEFTMEQVVIELDYFALVKNV